MQIVRSEIRTGLLVIISIGILTAILLALGAPGVFKPLKTFRIFFNNAAGIKPGAPVHLAGRQVGQVGSIYSPIPYHERPEGYREYEAVVEVKVEAGARIYREVDVMMQQSSLLGELVIDFLAGNEESGLAPDGAYFIGRREKSFTEAIAATLKSVEPVAEQAKISLQRLDETVKNFQRMTSEGSDFDLALENFKVFSDNLADLSGAGGPLDGTLKDLEQITSDLSDNDRIKHTLEKFEQAAEQFENAVANLDTTINEVSPDLKATTRYAQDFMDTLRHQPWRLIWPTTKRYPEDKRYPRDERIDWQRSAEREERLRFRQEGPVVQEEQARSRRLRRVHATGVRKYHGATRGNLTVRPRREAR
jgi:ABC-type transporter Mla subunit MlaD